jgi:hypothetical protein
MFNFPIQRSSVSGDFAAPAVPPPHVVSRSASDIAALGRTDREDLPLSQCSDPFNFSLLILPRLIPPPALPNTEHTNFQNLLQPTDFFAAN